MGRDACGDYLLPTRWDWNGIPEKGWHPHLDFGVSGLLYQSDVLMYDHHTESVWSQMAMQAVTGKTLGQRLEPIFLEHTTWATWRKDHHDTLVLSREKQFTRDYRRDPYEAYTQTDRLLFFPAKPDDRLSPKERVLGIEMERQYKASPFSTLKEMGRTFSDSLHDQTYGVCWDAQGKSAKIVDQQEKPFPTLTAYWFAWYAFHPDTKIFMKDSGIAKPDMKILDGVCEKL